MPRKGLRVVCVLLCACLASCSNVRFWEKPPEDDTVTLLLLLGAAAYLSNPCNFTASPLSASVVPSGANAGQGNIRGRLLTRAGQPAVSALVIAEDNANVGTIFWSSHTSLNRDGSFQISSIPNAVVVKLSFEPISSTFDNRIDRHIDCFKTPATFQAGWANSSGTLSTSRASGQNYSIVGGSTIDAGTIYLLN